MATSALQVSDLAGVSFLSLTSTAAVVNSGVVGESVHSIFLGNSAVL